MIVSVTLARGAIRMAKAQVIVKRLGAIHDLGSMDVLCTDKTGTLTEGQDQARAAGCAVGRRQSARARPGLAQQPFPGRIEKPARCRDRRGWPAARCRLDQDRRGAVRLSTAPRFGPRRARGRRLLITKGAPEDVIRLAVRYEEPGKPELLPLDDAARARAANVFDQLSAEGFRALGVAWRELEP